MADWKNNMFPGGDGTRLELTSGTFAGGDFWCVSAGTLTVTKNDNNTKVATVPAGGSITFNKGEIKSVSITTGTFHLTS